MGFAGTNGQCGCGNWRACQIGSGIQLQAVLANLPNGGQAAKHAFPRVKIKLGTLPYDMHVLEAVRRGGRAKSIIVMQTRDGGQRFMPIWPRI